MTLARPAQPTLDVIESHCVHFKHLFAEVRTFEHFQTMHVGLLSDTSRKTLPAIAKHLGLEHSQGLHHLLVTEHLDTQALRQQRLALVRQTLAHHPVTLMIDETGDRKKGTTTDYVSRQYLGSLGKVDNGLVTVHVVALLDGITFPLLWKVFKPKSRLRSGDVHRSKIQLAVQMLEEVANWGLHIELVVADSAYGMASEVVRFLQARQWSYALALRSDFGMYLPEGEKVWHKPWVKVARHLSDGSVQERWAQEVVWGKERKERYVVLTSDPKTQPANETSFVRTQLPGEDGLEKLADAYGQRTWIESSFRNQKTELGWHDWRVTKWEHIERWYELVLSSYTLVSRLAHGKVLETRESEKKCREEQGAEKEKQPVVKPRWCDALKEVRHWIEPIQACVMLMGWSSLLGVESSLLHQALHTLYQLSFPQ